MELLLQLLWNGLVLGLLYALYAHGFNIIVSTTHILHFAHGATFIIGAYAFWAMYVPFGLPFAVAALGTVVVTTLVGVGTERLVYWPLRRRGASDLVILAASIALLALPPNLITLFWGGQTRTMTRPTPSNTLLSVGVVGLTAWDLVVIGVSLLVFLAVLWFTARTWLGMAFRAQGDNAARAVTVGVESGRTIVMAFAVGSLLVAPVSILMPLDLPLTPGLGFNLLLKAVAALILGGIGSIGGALIGGLSIGFVEALAGVVLPSQWTEFVLFAVIFTFVMIRPTGFSRHAERLA